MEEGKTTGTPSATRLPTSGFITINVGGRIFHTTVETLKNGGGPSSSTYALRNSFRVSRQRSFSADAALFDGVGGLTTTFAAKPPPGARQQVGKVSLASHPPVQTFFSALFDPTRFSGPPTVDAEGRLFLDRDGDVFEYVLRYLRTGKIFSDEEDGSDDEMDSGAYESEDSEEGEETHEWAPGDEIGRTPPSSPRLPIESRNTSVTSPRSVGLEAAQQTRSTPSVMSRSHSDSHPTVEAGGSSQHDTSEATSSVSPPTGTRPTATVAASSSRGNANPPSSSAGHALRTLATLPLPIPRGPTNIPSSSSHPIQSAHSPPSGSGTLSPPPRVTRPLSAPTSHAAPPTAVPGSLRSNHARGQSFSAGGAAVTQAQRSQRTSSRKSLRGRTSVTTSAASGHNVTDSPSTGSFPTSLLLKVKAEGSFFALDNLVEKCERIVERRKREKEDREVAKEVVEYRTVDLTDDDFLNQTHLNPPHTHTPSVPWILHSIVPTETTLWTCRICFGGTFVPLEKRADNRAPWQVPGRCGHSTGALVTLRGTKAVMVRRKGA